MKDFHSWRYPSAFDYEIENETNVTLWLYKLKSSGLFTNYYGNAMEALYSYDQNRHSSLSSFARLDGVTSVSINYLKAEILHLFSLSKENVHQGRNTCVIDLIIRTKMHEYVHGK